MKSKAYPFMQRKIYLTNKKNDETKSAFGFFLNNQPDALIVQIYSVIKLYMFRASSLAIITSFLLYIRHW